MSVTNHEGAPLLGRVGQEDKSRNRIQKNAKQLLFSNVVVPLTVGGPCKSSTQNAEGFRWLHSDASMSSALFCLAYVAMRFVILMGKVIMNKFPDGHERKIKFAWIIMQDLAVWWLSVAIIIQVCLIVAIFHKSKFFEEQKKSLRHETEENQIWIRTGIVLFSIGSVVLISSRIYDNCHCLSLRYFHKVFHGCEITLLLLLIVFIILQSIYILVASKKHLKIQNHPLLRFAYMYLVGTDIIISMYTFATEVRVRQAVFKSLKHPEYFERAIIEPDFAICKLLHHTETNEVLWYIFVYLHPFLVEFNLLAVEILCHQWAEMRPLGEDASILHGGSSGADQNCPELQEINNENKADHKQKQIKDNIQGTDHFPIKRFGRSKILVFLMVALFTWLSGMLNALHRYMPQVPCLVTVYFVYDSTLKVVSIGVILWGFTLIPQGGHSRKSGFLGSDILLIVTGLCYVFLNLMILLADGATDKETITKKIINILLDSNYFFFVWFQTLFIIHIQHRPLPTIPKDIYKLTLIIVALGTHSLFIWAKMSFVTLNLGRWYPISIDTYGIPKFMTCLYVFYPIGFFYYFTSARLLANYYHQISKAILQNKESEIKNREVST